MSDQTPIEKARQWYLDYYDLHDLAVNGLAKGDEQTIELLAAFAAHVEAQRVPVSYAMSKNYDRLYDHLCNGGEALAAVIYTGQEKGAKWLRAPELHTSTSLSRSINFGGIYVSEHGDHRAEFITSCTRLNLEWLAPAQPLSAQQVFDVVEEFIKQEAERVGTDQPTGLEYPVGHRHWNNMIADLRERLNKLIG